MSSHDAQQVCLNGHQITDSYHRSPEFRSAYCDICGAKSIYQCPSCDSEIPGYYYVEGVFTTALTPIPEYCKSCGSRFPWAGKNDVKEVQTSSDCVALDVLERICKKLPLVIR